MNLPFAPTHTKLASTDAAIETRLHNPPSRPHWSELIDWRPGRWDPMTNAPTRGRVLEVRGRDAAGRVLEPMHYACGDGDGLMPAFDGWFVPGGDGFVGVDPVEWQPLRAEP